MSEGFVSKLNRLVDSIDELEGGIEGIISLAAVIEGIEEGATANSTDDYLLNRSNHTGYQSSNTITPDGDNLFVSQAQLTKLNTVNVNATVNDTDANLRARSTHTGTQSADTIVDGNDNVVMTHAERAKLNSHKIPN